MQRISTKSIVEGAMLLGILVILSILTMYAPVLGVLTFIVLPMPVLFAIFRHNFKIAVMIGFLSVILLIIVGINPASAMINSIYATLTGLALGYGFSRRIRPTITLILTSAAILLAGIIIVYISAAFLQINIINQAIDAQITAFETVVEFVWGLSDRYPAISELFRIPDNREDLEIFKGDLRVNIIFILPAVLAMVAVIYGFLNFVVARLVLKRFRIDTSPLPHFINWRFGDWLIWVFVFSFLLSMIAPIQLRYIAYNVNQIAMIGIVIQGAAVTFYLISKKINSIFIKVLVVSFIAVFFSPIAMLIGIVDFFWNFRRI